MSREAFLEIKELGQHMGAGEQASGRLCPFCKGGSSKDLSFSVTRTPTNVLYICHRASCGHKGSISMMLQPTNHQELIPVVPPVKKDTSMAWEMESLPTQVLKELENRYLLDAELIRKAGILWEKKLKRLWIPIRGEDKLTMGVNLRSLDKNVKPKCRIHVSLTTKIPAAFYFNEKGDTDVLYLVEDQFSAMRLSRYVSACALMGTNISDALLLDLKKLHIEEVVVALDRDAYKKSIAAYKMLSPLFDRVAIVRLDKDIKDMDEQAVKDLIDSVELRVMAEE